jgi:hypothetical protein
MSMPIQEIGPGGRHAGRVVGLIPALEIVGRYAPAGLVAYDALRGHNDQPEGHILGSSGGRLVVRDVRGLADLGGETEEEFAARAQQAGKENRQFYGRVVGTPRRKPPDLDPYETPKTKPKPDTSDLRRWTP